MANLSYEALIKCPFYLKLGEKTIACEGHKTGTCMMTRFSSVQAKKEHLKRNCYSETGGKCFLAAALFKKYNDEDC